MILGGDNTQFEIIDFHTHPFTYDNNNLCPYASHCGMTPDTTTELMDTHNVSKFCGSDYPTCSLPMYIGVVLLDSGITDTEKEYIFSKNAKRILNI